LGRLIIQGGGNKREKGEIVKKTWNRMLGQIYIQKFGNSKKAGKKKKPVRGSLGTGWLGGSVIGRR